MLKSATEHSSNEDTFVCERCKHRFVGYVINGNRRYCNECGKLRAIDKQRSRRNNISSEEHVSHATIIIDNFLQECLYKKPKFVKISEVLFWIKEHPENIPKYWTSDRAIRRWITHTLKTNYPYKPFMGDVYIRDD